MLLDSISQVFIVILGTASIILVAKKNKWGFVLGLLSQPFYIYTSLVNEQWGIFITSFIYTGSWIFGIYEWFFKDKKKQQ